MLPEKTQAKIGQKPKNTYFKTKNCKQNNENLKKLIIQEIKF